MNITIMKGRFTNILRLILCKKTLLPIIIAAFFCILFSCTKETTKNHNGQTGTLLISYGKIEIDNNIATIGTKAAPIPLLGDFNMKLTPKGSGESYEGVAFEGEHILLTDNYTLEISYGLDYTASENAPFSTTPYYYGSTTFQISAGVKTPITVNARFKGSILNVKMPQDLINHYKTYQIKVTGGSGESAFETTMIAGSQLFVKHGIPIIITLEGTNQVDQISSTQLFNSTGLTNGVISDNTEYIITANIGNLPTITLPSQYSYNSWATKHIITTATLSSGDVSKLIYEAIPSSSDDWSSPIISTGDTNPVFTFTANPNDAVIYKMRASYGIIKSNEVTFKAEIAQQIQNSTFEQATWVSVDKGGLWSSGGGNIYNYSYPNWTTNNSPYADAPSSEYKVLWKWDSLVEPDNGTAKISTKGFATKKLGWADVGVTYVNKIQDSFNSNPITGNGEFKADFLPLKSRPLSISFQYKYISYPESQDNNIIYMNIYNASKELIATTNTYNGSDLAALDYITLPITDTGVYSTSEVQYISIYFKSGSKTGVAAAKYVQGAYTASPFGKSQFIGSQLWIDSITLNY